MNGIQDLRVSYPRNVFVKLFPESTFHGFSVCSLLTIEKLVSFFALAASLSRNRFPLFLQEILFGKKIPSCSPAPTRVLNLIFFLH